MKKPIVYRLVTLLVPLICLFVAGVVTLYESHRYHQLQAELSRTERQLTDLNRLIKEIERQPPVAILPADVQSPKEQSNFLTLLRAYADGSHVQLTNWSNTAQAAPTEGEKRTLPSDISAIVSAIEITGTYKDARLFLYRLMSAPRLFSMGDMAWGRNDKWPITSLKFTLTRYVAPSGSIALRNLDVAYKSMWQLPDPFAKKTPQVTAQATDPNSMLPLGLRKEPVYNDLPGPYSKATKNEHSTQGASQEVVR
jgi:hypothetical protein